MRPLNEQTEKAKKILMKEAQDAIFKAQDTTMKYSGTSEVEQEIIETDEKLSRLKELVLQSSWKKDDVKDSIDELRQAHASLAEKVEVIENKKKKEEEEAKEEEVRQATAKAEEELKAQRKALDVAEKEEKEKEAKKEEQARKTAAEEFNKQKAKEFALERENGDAW